MKNCTYIIFILSVFSLISAQDDCPFGLTDDPYPGRCGRYIDANGNEICDLSESAVEESIPPSSDSLVTEEKQNEIIGNNEFTDNGDGRNNSNQNIEDENNADAANDNQGDDAANNEKETKKTTPFYFKKQAVKKESNKDRYLLFIWIPLYFFAFILAYFSKNKKIRLSLCDYSRILNTVILVSFAVVLFTSIMLVLNEYKILNLGNISRLAFIHSITGIIFILTSLLHLYLKWSYYENIIKCYIKGDR